MDNYFRKYFVDLIMHHPDLIERHHALINHSMYNKIRSIHNLKIMMESHVFAVWDFMSLLKRLQKEITCVELPWRPSCYSKKLVRLINEIVLVEESDIDSNGEPSDHFTIYLKAMDEIGAKKDILNNFIQDLDFNKLSLAQRKFIQFNLELSVSGKLHEVAAAFFFGREKIIPDMFTSILKDLEKNMPECEQNLFPHLKYYLARHIQIDGEEHSHLAHACLVELCGNDRSKWEEAKNSGIKSLELRWQRVLPVGDLYKLKNCN